MKVVEAVKAAGVHALQDQLNSHGTVPTRGEDGRCFVGDVDGRLLRYVSGRLADIEHFDGFWQTRPAESRPCSAIGASANLTARSTTCAI